VTGAELTVTHTGLDAGAVTVLVAGASAAIGTDMARFIWLAPSV
jgi:hypothetical protein